VWEVSVAVPAWGSLDPVRVLRSALLAVGFLLLVVLGVVRLLAGDGRGLAFVALGVAGLIFMTRRGLSAAIWLGVALDGALGFLGDSGYRGAELVAGVVGAGVALIPVQTAGLTATDTDAPHRPASMDGEPTGEMNPELPTIAGPAPRLTISTIGRFEVVGPDGDLTGELSRRPVQEFLWLFLLARKLAGLGPITRPALAEVLSPRIDSDEQGNRLRRRISDMQSDLAKPLLECLVLKGREVDFNLNGCQVDVLRLTGLRERLQAAGEIPPPELVKEAEATLQAVGFGKFLPSWEEIETRMTAAKGSAGDTIVEVRVVVSEDRAAIVLALTSLYRAAGTPARAIPLLVKVLDDNEEIEDVARALVAIYLNTGQFDKAKEAKRKYLSDKEE
jgi:Tetratricopeptide repeat